MWPLPTATLNPSMMTIESPSFETDDAVTRMHLLVANAGRRVAMTMAKHLRSF